MSPRRRGSRVSKDIEEILAPKPVARPRIYAYSINDEAHKGLLKVGQTTRDVKQRVAEQLKTASIKNYTIELDESAERDDGTIFSDHEVRAALRRKKLESAGLKFVSDDRTTPEYLAKFVQSEIAKWAVPIKASGVSVD